MLPTVEGPQRRLDVGAEVFSGGVHFRVWAPGHREVDLIVHMGNGKAARKIPLEQQEKGYFSLSSTDVTAGCLYNFTVDGTNQLLSDPASRFQPEGPFGPSEVIDPGRYAWQDSSWDGPLLKGQVIYELHIGTFTAEGTWASAAEQLQRLSNIGITSIEMMPIADFPGPFGWGYDGVNLFAPTRLYGRPDDLRSFVERAHGLGMAVLLDVVYNHFGPMGNALPSFSPHYLTERHVTDWGSAINYDGAYSGPVREFFLANAEYWIREYHFDGLRLDATQTIFDKSDRHILSEITARVRRAAGERCALVIAENESQDTRLLRPTEEGGFGIDAVWNDDFHHSARVLMTGHNPAYYCDYEGRPQEFISCLKRGYLYQGQYYRWQSKRRGTRTEGLKPSAFVAYLENHDQIANTYAGIRPRLLTSPGKYRAMSALLLLSPCTPLLFQGQEFGSDSPWTFFASLAADSSKDAFEGRLKFLAQFPMLSVDTLRAQVARPDDPTPFAECKIDYARKDERVLRLYRDLLALRAADPTFSRQGTVDGAVLGNHCFVIRFSGAEPMEDRLLVVNTGRDYLYSPCPEPLLAPPPGVAWQPMWTSDDPTYGGEGFKAVETKDGWHLPGASATVLGPAEGR